ncbi:MAG: bifunctional metallophosphatase/5'-nucleotidase [Bacteroidales bacterium]|nr:bifunctional metallophosphatase/5'-nucleotidase [Bacteroidales bacterium]
MKRYFLILSLAVLAASCGPKNGVHTLHVLTTNDIHGSYFDSTYVGGGVRKSMFALKYYVDSVRTAVGEDNVLLLDAGDFLQGDNAAYYFNYVDTVTPHVFPRLAEYLKYDAVTGGNHDIETGHRVYDRVAADFKEKGIPFLGGNVIDTATGKPYFQTCALFRKAGLKVAVLGYNNANMKAWLDESLWSGLDFLSLVPLVQQDVDAVRAKENPQVVVVVVHSGTGAGDGQVLESQGKDLYQSLQGVDFVVCSHDHRPAVLEGASVCLLNSGSHMRYVAHGQIDVTVKDRKAVSKKLAASLIPVDARKADPAMREAFRSDFEAVRAFTRKEVGELQAELRTRDAYRGMCDYMNLIHTVCLQASGAQLSMAAPLTYNGRVQAGTLIFNDMFTIYPFENQLFVVELTGREVKDYLEYSYDQWIRTMARPGDHVLKIEPRDDPRTGQQRWSFPARSYNFDSAAGLDYTVDVTRPCGQRVKIASLSSGAPFDPEKRYTVAMTSYRASGGGGLLLNGAGLQPEESQRRIVGKYPEIRNLVYDYVRQNGVIDPVAIADPALVGRWSFVPAALVAPAMDRDMALLFGN